MAYPHHLLNSPFGDTTFTKVFVGGLAWETKSEALRRHFEQYGDIFEAVVISDKNTGRSKGYGFVTFCDAESARRACADPSPVIDGRQANCNLASLGRPRPAIPYAQLRPPGPYFGSVLAPRGAYVGSSTFQNVPYSYNQAALYSPYRYPAYGPEYVFPQNVQNSYMGQQYFQVYNVPYGQLGQQIPAVQSYSVPGHHFVQLGGQNIDGVTASPRPSIQAPYPSAAVPAHPQFIVPAQSPQFTQGSGSD